LNCTAPTSGASWPRTVQQKVRVFCSVARGQDTEASDLDILVDPTERTSLLDVAAIKVELEDLSGLRVDVLTPKALP
jgi:predicted nucleotidyltransferase